MGCSGSIIGLWVACVATVSVAGATVAVLDLGTGSRELHGIFGRVGVDVVEIASLANLGDGPDSSVFDALAVCVPVSEQPLRLDREQSEALLAFARAGGRVFLEYACPAPGSWPGWSVTPEPVLERFERLRITEVGARLTGLEPETLLEDHNTFLLPATPAEGADVLAWHGLYMGTYRRAPELGDRPTWYEVVIDLGAGQRVSAVSQAFGGLQASYVPDAVTLYAGDSPESLRPLARATPVAENGTVPFEIPPTTARFVTLRAEKTRTSPVTDFLVLDCIRVSTPEVDDCAAGRPYLVRNAEGVVRGWETGGLTTRRTPRAWQEDRTYVFPVPAPRGLNRDRWPGLVRWRVGQGEILWAAAPVSTFRERHCRLTVVWESLLQGIALALLPESERDRAAEQILPLRCHTTPRVWCPSRAEVTLHVDTRPETTLRVVLPWTAAPLMLEADDDGIAELAFAPPDGDHMIEVTAHRNAARGEADVPLSVCPRETAYRRALDRCMAWFLASGVLEGTPAEPLRVRSGLEIGSFTGGPAEDLASPYRADCQAMVAKAFHLYGDVSGDPSWHGRALALARYLLSFQFLEPGPAFGAFRWLAEGDGSRAIYPQDDNNRVAEALAWLYTRNGDTELLRAALRAVEFARATSREDGILVYWSTWPDELRERGLHGMRCGEDLVPVVDWCLFRYHYAWRATGDPVYRDLLRPLTRVYGGLSVDPNLRAAAFANGGAAQVLFERGAAVALAVGDPDPSLRAGLERMLIGYADAYLEHDDVRAGAAPGQAWDLDPANLDRAYRGDSGIHTHAAEPLTDQLYTVSKSALMAWEACQAFPDQRLQDYVDSLLDYLVRIQTRTEDRRLDGCWLRGFDTEHWEAYGTRYDPNYGAYHAYSGWMNATIATALAYRLLGENPFASDPEWYARARDVLAEVRDERHRLLGREQNHAAQCSISADPPPEGGRDALSRLTDALLEGERGENSWAWWRVPRGDVAVRVVVVAVPAAPVDLHAVALRTGGLDTRCSPDRIRVRVRVPGLDGWQTLVEAGLNPARLSHWFAFPRVRVAEIEMLVEQRTPEPDGPGIALGEVLLMGPAGGPDDR